jgi:hypothetical protein
MAISYPLTLPSAPGFRELTFRPVNINGQATSEFTGQTQITQWNGEWWEADLVLPPMVRATAEAWLAFITALRGTVGTFYLGPEKNARTALGTAAGVTVNGAAQSGTTITLAGTGSFAAGDWIQLGSGSTSRLHKVLIAAPAAGSVEIFPRLRESPSNGSSVVVSSPKGVFRLAEDAREWNVDVARMYGLRFSAREAF